MRDEAITIGYQILEGISFLHLRNVDHGDITPTNILFDRYGNARLTNYGMYRAYCAEEFARTRHLDASHRTGSDDFINADKCFTHDLWQFASLFLQFFISNEQSQFAAMSYLTESLSVLKEIRKSCSTHSTVRFQQKGQVLLIEESFDHKSFTRKLYSVHPTDTSLKVEPNESAGKVLVSKSFNCRYFVDNYLDKMTWPTDGTPLSLSRKYRYKLTLTFLLIKCLWMRCDRSTASRLAAEMRQIVREMELPRLSLTAVVDDQNSKIEICRYCTVAPIHSELRLRRTECPEKCPFLYACISCIQLFGLCQVYSADNSIHGCKHADALNSGSVENICPDHQCVIEPVFGGERAYAMILSEGEREVDAMKMVQLVSHPKCMQIPYDNVYRITFRKGKNYMPVVRTVRQILLEKKPSFVMIYYSGHQLVLADDKTKVRPEYARLVKKLKRFITEIRKICPRTMLMFDCCYAEAVADLFDVRLDDDACVCDVEWHAQWMSSRRNEKSCIDPDRELSRYTELVESAVKGGTQAQCLAQKEKCNDCSKFRKQLVKNDCVKLCDAVEFVRKHAHSIQNWSQNAVFKGTSHSAVVISFFNKEPKLYTVFIEDTTDGSICACEMDSLYPSDIWDMTLGHHPAKVCMVEYYERYSKRLLCSYSSDKEYINIKLLLKLLNNDNQCLLVKFK